MCVDSNSIVVGVINLEALAIFHAKLSFDQEHQKSREDFVQMHILFGLCVTPACAYFGSSTFLLAQKLTFNVFSQPIAFLSHVMMQTQIIRGSLGSK